MTVFELTAPCGIDCFNCEVHVTNITPELQKLLAAKLGKGEDEIVCLGCRTGKGCVLLARRECATRQCAFSKSLAFCYECNEFPCNRLLPCAEGADKFPHNLKLFNLCRIKKIGIEQWAAQEARENRTKYFKGRFAIGQGPLV